MGDIADYLIEQNLDYNLNFGFGSRHVKFVQPSPKEKRLHTMKNIYRMCKNEKQPINLLELSNDKIKTSR